MNKLMENTAEVCIIAPSAGGVREKGWVVFLLLMPALLKGQQIHLSQTTDLLYYQYE